MKIITGLSEQPKQQSTLVLADGTRAVWSISYVAQQTGWFYDLSWNGTVIATGQRMVSSPNILRQYINKISFGIAVISPNQLEPTTQTALVDGTVTCYLLEGTDLQTIETTLFNAPAGQVQPVATTPAGAPVVVLPANWGPAGGDLAYAYPNPQVVAMHDGTGQRLAFGTVADNQFLKRVGATVVGATVAPGTGDVVGPATSTIGNVALWADAAGTEISDGGTLGTAAFLPSSNFLGATAAATGDLSGNYPSPRVAAIHTTTGGGTKLTIGAVADGQYLVRSGNDLIGSTPSGAGDVFGPSSTVTVGTVALFATTDGKTLGPSAITLGTIASQAASNVSITGGSIAGAVITSGTGGSISGVPINGSAIGAITASSGRFSSVVSTSSISAATTITATGNIGAANFSGSSSGTNTGDQTNIAGNAATATALANTFTIGGSNFNGTANVTSFPVPGPIGVTTPAAANFTSIGLTTQGTAAFTSGTFSGNLTLTGIGADNTGLFALAGSGYRFGLFRHDPIGAGSALLSALGNVGVMVGATASSTSGTLVGTFSATGLAVIGALSSTTGANFATSSGSVGIGTSSTESGFKLHVTGNGFFSQSSGTVGKVVVDNVDQRLVLGAYFEAGIGQYSFISSTNNAETGDSDLRFRTGTTDRMTLSSTGLAISGTISTGGNVILGGSADFFNGSVRISDSASANAPAYFQSGEPGISANNVILSNNYYGVSGGASGRKNSSLGASFIRLNVGSASTSSTTLGFISASGTQTDVGTFSSTGLALAARLDLSGAPTFAAGSIYLNATNGVTIAGKTGATNDFLLADNGGNTVLRNPTGTANLVTGGNLAVTGGISSTAGANFATSSGVVNIGTTTPSFDTRLTVQATGDFAPAISVRDNANVGNWARMDLLNSNTAGPMIFAQIADGQTILRNEGTNSSILFQTAGGVTRAAISTAGLAVTGTINGVTLSAGTGTPALTVNGAASISGSNTGDQTLAGLGGQPASATLTALATGSAFVKFIGPTTPIKEFTLPDATATILTSNAAVTVAQGGTGLTSYTTGDLIYASNATTLAKLALGGAGQVLKVNGAGTALEYGSVSGGGTVTSVSVVAANGFTGTVATPTADAAITLKTTVNGILKGNSTSGVVSAAAAGTDYQAPITLTTTGTSGAATFTSNTLNIPQYGGIAIPTAAGNQYARLGRNTASALTGTADLTWYGPYVFNVKDYGAVGNGSADDTAAITAAIAAAVASPFGGGAVYFPSGVYKTCKQAISTSGKSIRIFGDGDSSQVRSFSTPSIPMASTDALFHFVNVPPTEYSCFSITNIQLICDVSCVALRFNCLPVATIHVRNLAYVDRVTVTGGGANWTGGIQLTSAHNAIISNSIFDGGSQSTVLGNSAIQMVGLISVGVVISNCNFNFWTYGMRCEIYQEGILFDTCLFIGNKYSGLYSVPSTALRITSIQYVNCNFDARGTGNHAIYCNNVQGLLLSNNYFIGGDGIFANLYLRQVQFSTITGNKFFTTGNEAIQLLTSADPAVTTPVGAPFPDPPLPVACAAVAITGNTFYGDAVSVRVGVNCVNIVVQNNVRSSGSGGNTVPYQQSTMVPVTLNTANDAGGTEKQNYIQP